MTSAQTRRSGTPDFAEVPKIVATQANHCLPRLSGKNPPSLRQGSWSTPDNPSSRLAVVAAPEPTDEPVFVFLDEGGHERRLTLVRTEAASQIRRATPAQLAAMGRLLEGFEESLTDEQRRKADALGRELFD
jgi:hypothetical protein